MEKMHKNTLNLIIRYKFSELRRKYYGINDVTIICNNCLGGILYKTFNLKFSSPLINLFIETKDYMKLLKKLDYYLACDLNFIETDLEFPVAELDDIKIYFMHYKTIEEAKFKWNTRLSRVNLENICFIYVQREDCTYEDLKCFDNLPFHKKIALTFKDYPEFKSTFKISGFGNDRNIDVIKWSGYLRGKKYIDQFNWGKWLSLNKE